LSVTSDGCHSSLIARYSVSHGVTVTVWQTFLSLLQFSVIYVELIDIGVVLVYS